MDWRSRPCNLSLQLHRRNGSLPNHGQLFRAVRLLPMSQRIDKSWLVFASIANFEHDRCVDFFSRPDGSFGFEEVRRDPEDRGAWTPVQYHSRTTSVRRAVRWHGRNCDGVRPLTFSTAADLTSRASVTRRPPGDLFPPRGNSGGGRPFF